MSQRPTIGLISLGCPKALVDSQIIINQLNAEGYRIVPSYDEAQLVIVNTCGFINPAVEESLHAIGEALQENGRVIVTGCLGSHPERIRAVHPAVLAISGAHAYEEVLQAVHEHLPPPAYEVHHDLVPPSHLSLTPRHYAYIKISEGCHHDCSFCIIPTLRGPLHSRPITEILREAETLVEHGVKELLIIAQDTASYGRDLGHQRDFYQGRPLRSDLLDLCRALADLDVWIRLHYVYPYPHVDAIIPLMAEGLILPYLDIPLQHADPEILRAMRRPAAMEKTLERIEAWRRICPDLSIRSSFIVGFPGETEEHFQHLLDFIDAAAINRAGCFTYSPVEGAAANALPHAVPEEVKEERRARFMQRQAAISAQLLAEKIGDILPVLVDETAPAEHRATARSAYDAPEIDGVVYIDEIDGIAPGDMLHVEIEDADEHDLYARPA